MNFKINNIIQNGRIGMVDLEIEGEKFSWEWEFGVGKYVAMISVPGKKEWDEIFVKSRIKRKECLSEIAKEIINLKCRGCYFKVTDTVIAIFAGQPKY